MPIDPNHYMGRLVDYCMVAIHALVTVKETGKSWTGEDKLIMEKPKLDIAVSCLEVMFKRERSLKIIRCINGVVYSKSVMPFPYILVIAG